MAKIKGLRRLLRGREAGTDKEDLRVDETGNEVT